MKQCKQFTNAYPFLWIKFLMYKRSGCCFFLRALCVAFFFLCVSLRVHAVQVRVASFNIYWGVGTPGSEEYNAVRDIIKRIDPDIIGFQELNNGDYDNWISLAAALNYPHVAFGSGGPFAGSHRLGFFSRYTITQADEVKEPTDAKEITRWPLHVVIEVPGALHPLNVYVVHNKAMGGSVNEFRRGVEIRRTLSYILSWIESNPLDTEYLIMGYFNDDVNDYQTAQFNALPNGLPSSYVLGADMSFPILYDLYPTDRCGELNMSELHPKIEDSTLDDTYISGGRLDYIYLSKDIQNSPYGAPVSEVYYSPKDDGIGGLQKVGVPLAADTSATASDLFCSSPIST